MNRQQTNKSYYLKNQAKLKILRQEKYQQQKEQTQLTAQQQSAKYYGAEAIKVLMSLKEYTELNRDKMKLWADFCWTLKDCQKGISDIVFIMKLRESAENLINDYWKTAKSEVKRGKNWNSLTEEQQSKLIKYWSREKARAEKGYLTEEEKLTKQSQEYEKELELAKFHEERGKFKCSCSDCELKKEIRTESKKYLEPENQTEKEQCSQCNRWVKWLDEENYLCRSCLENYE